MSSARMFLAIFFIVLIGTASLFATYIDTGQIEFTQPNGANFIGRTWGDEFEHFSESKDGYRFVFNYENKYYYYAILNSKGDFVASNLKVGIDNPFILNIPKHLEQTGKTRDLIDSRRKQFQEDMKRIRLSRLKNSMSKRNLNKIAQTTTIEIAAIMVEFSDVKHDPQYTLEDFNNMLTAVGIYNYWDPGDSPHPQGLDVWGSIHDYYDAMSNGDINFTGGVLNVSSGSIDWIELDHTKDYYNNHSSSLFLNEVLSKAASKGYNTLVMHATRSVYEVNDRVMIPP